jgi:hypothetical protein
MFEPRSQSLQWVSDMSSEGDARCSAAPWRFMTFPTKESLYMNRRGPNSFTAAMLCLT